MDFQQDSRYRLNWLALSSDIPIWSIAILVNWSKSFWRNCAKTATAELQPNASHLVENFASTPGNPSGFPFRCERCSLMRKESICFRQRWKSGIENHETPLTQKKIWHEQMYQEADLAILAFWLAFPEVRLAVLVGRLPSAYCVPLQKQRCTQPADSYNAESQ